MSGRRCGEPVPASNWGRILDDWVLEDTLALEQACKIQALVPA